MGYIPTGATEEEYRDTMLALRVREVELEELRFEDSKKPDFWKNLGRVATVGIPLLTFFGFKEILAARRRKRKS